MPEQLKPVEKVGDVARRALRRIRSAAVHGDIDAETMQTESKKVLHLFAKALLKLTHDRLLKDEDKKIDIDHVKNLNDYVQNLFPETKELHDAGPEVLNWISLNSFAKNSTRDHLDKFKHAPDQDPVFIALLSTGALGMAILSYIHNIDLYVAAISSDKSTIVLPELPTSKPIIIVDDIVKGQAEALETHIRDVKKNDPVPVRSYNLAGQRVT